MNKTVFPTERKERFRTSLKRLGFNFFPAYRRTGGRICFLSDDWREIHIRLGLSWKTKNYVGTVFGGSIYGALDPIYMVQLINILGSNYIVWDKAATVKFLKPISATVYARFLITDELLNEIVSAVASNNKHTIDLSARFEDERGAVYAEVRKTLFIADKKYYESLKSRRSV
jgi:acyl-coenzyme A thioesterase PaaI-like protein